MSFYTTLNAKLLCLQMCSFNFIGIVTYPLTSFVIQLALMFIIAFGHHHIHTHSDFLLLHDILIEAWLTIAHCVGHFLDYFLDYFLVIITKSLNPQTFSCSHFLKTYRNEMPWKQHQDNKCWSNVATTNTCEVIEHERCWWFMCWITNRHMLIVHHKTIANMGLSDALGCQHSMLTTIVVINGSMLDLQKGIRVQRLFCCCVWFCIVLCFRFRRSLCRATARWCCLRETEGAWQRYFLSSRRG